VTPLFLEAVSKVRGAGRRAVQALRDVSLALAPAEVVLLEGPSGAGKTTLLAVAAGLLAVDSGRVLLADRFLDTLSPAARRRHRAQNVGFVFQRSNLLGRLTARENVILMGMLAGMSAASAGRRADVLLEQLGLAAFTHKLPRELSGGEEQRVAVARSLVHGPAIVLADEPTGNLDSASGRTVAEALASLAREHQAAVLVASHDQRLAPFATRRVMIADGELDATAS